MEKKKSRKKRREEGVDKIVGGKKRTYYNIRWGLNKLYCRTETIEFDIYILFYIFR